MHGACTEYFVQTVTHVRRVYVMEHHKVGFFSSTKFLQGLDKFIVLHLHGTEQ